MSSEKSGHPLLAGIVIGCVMGFAAGWWFPPPASVNMPKVREESKKTVAVGTEKAKDKLADASVELARKLREGETNNGDPGEPGLQASEAEGDPDLQEELRAADKLLRDLADERRVPAREEDPFSAAN